MRIITVLTIAGLLAGLSSCASSPTTTSSGKIFRGNLSLEVLEGAVGVKVSGRQGWAPQNQDNDVTAPNNVMAPPDRELTLDPPFSSDRPYKEGEVTLEKVVELRKGEAFNYHYARGEVVTFNVWSTTELSAKVRLTRDSKTLVVEVPANSPLGVTLSSQNLE